MSGAKGQSSPRAADLPLWMRPLVVFFSVAGGVSVAGSLLLVVIWLAGGESDRPSVAQAPVTSSVVSPPPADAASAIAAPPVAPEPVAPTPAASPSPIVETEASGSVAGNAAESSPQPTPAGAAPAAPLIVGRGVKTLSLDQFPAVDLPGEAKGFAYAPDEEHLGVIGPWDSAVGFLAAPDLLASGEVAPKKVILLPSAATGIAFKPLSSGGIFAVTHAEPNGVMLIDAATLAPVKTVSLEEGRPHFVAAAETAATPFVYVAVGGSSSSRRPIGLVRLDVERGEVETAWERVYRDFAVSADGEYLYTRPNNSNTDLHRSRPVKPVEGEQRDNWQTVTSRVGRVTRPYVPDRRGLFVAAGYNLYTADIAHHLVELEFDPLAFLTELPWIAGLRKDEFVVGSINDGRMVVKVPLPPDWLIPDAQYRKPPTTHQGPTAIHPAAFGRVFADEKQSRFLLCTRRRVAVFPFEKLNLPEEPILALAAAPPATAAAGLGYEAPLRTISGSSHAELVEGPEGMTVENGAVRWTPRPDQVGDVNVRVRLIDGKLAHEDVWRIEVKQKTFELPFLVLGCDPSTDGKQLLVWGHDWPTEEKGVHNWSGYKPPPESHLALLDATTGAVLASRTIDATIAQGELNATGAYVTADAGFGREPGEVLRLNPSDLRSAGRGTVASGQLLSIADTYLVSQRPNDHVAAIYQLPDLKLAQESKTRRIGSAPLPLAARLADGWLLDGAVWDDGLKQIQLVLDPSELRSAMRTNRSPQSPIAAFPVLQGYVLQRGDTAGPQLYGWQQDRARYTPDFPAQLKFRRDNQLAVLEVADLTTQEVIRAVTLRAQFPMATKYPYGSDNIHIATTREAVFASHLGELIVIPVGGMELTPPFRIVPRQSTVELSAARPQQVTYEAEGATKFELHIPGLDTDSRRFLLESADGAFEIDVSNAVEEFARTLVQSARETPQAFPGGIETWAKTYMESQREQVRKLTGKPPGGVPLRLDAFVRASGQGRMAVLQHVYLVDVPLRLFRAEGGEQAKLANSGRVSQHAAPDQPQPARPQPAQPRRPSTPSAPAQAAQLTAVQYSQAFRQSHAAPAKVVALESLRAKVESLNRKLEAELATGQAGGEIRTWTDVQGRTIRAAFGGTEGNVVIVNDEQGRTFRVPLEKFSEADRQWVGAQSQAAAPQSDARRVRAMQRLGLIFHLHHDRLGSFPPAALVNDQGQPLLSWRVLLLEDMGYGNLARQFNYNEPWDSEHNRQLIPLMPAIFRGDESLASEGRTPLAAVVDPAGAVSDRFATRLGDFKDSSGEALLFVETAPGAAPVWTQPQDIPSASLGKIADLLAAPSGRATVVLADGAPATLPRDTREYEWKKLVNIRDGLKLGFTLDRLAPVGK